ncbi:glycosyltransferase [Nocardioides sp.]|uniref:glycosyltransferase n=1 Tax=Nocardioides sp. TaxID=35761 RepID=UPI0035153130
MPPTPRIPAVFHFVYGLREQDAPFPLHHHLCLASCRAVNPGARVVVHLHHRPWGPWWDRIAASVEVRQLDPAALGQGLEGADPAHEPYRHAHLSDFVRLEILMAEGGYYADIDSIFVRPAPHEWSAAPAIMGHELPPHGAAGSLCNAWIAAQAGSAFITEWRRRMPAAFDGSWSNHSTLLPYRLSVEMPEAVRVEAETRFFALDYTRAGLADLFDRRVGLPPDAVSLHLWEHLWHARERVDFTTFHAGLLTPDYVAFADTTYAHLARPHLPPDVVVSRVRFLAQQASRRRQDARLRLQAARARLTGQSRP